MELIQLLRDRNRRGMEILYDNYSTVFYGIIYQIIKIEAISEDILQESFVKIWSNISQYDPAKGRLFTWMLSICRNNALDKVRSREFLTSAQNQNSERLVSTENPSLTTSFNPDLIGIRDVVDNLDPEYKQIIECLYFRGFTQSETALKLNIPLGTVKTRARTAIMKLRQSFSQIKTG